MSDIPTFGIIPVKINDVTYNSVPEYTSREVVNFYNFYLSVFADVFTEEGGVVLNETTGQYEYPAPFENDPEGAIKDALENKPYTDPFSNPPDLPITLVDKFNQSIEGLIIVANGLIGVDRPYMTASMATAVDQLFRSIEAAGISLAFDGNDELITPINIEMILNWKNLIQNSNTIREILIDLVATKYSDKTLQSLIELIYVKTGNEILSESLEDLEGALGTTRSVLETLNELQNFHNKVAPQDLNAFNPSISAFAEDQFNNMATVFMHGAGNYDITPSTDPFIQVADAFFKGIIPHLPSGNHPAFVPAGSTNFFDNNQSIGEDFLKSYNDIANQISALAKDGSQFIKGKLPSAFDSALIAPGTLLDRMRTIYNDITAAINWASNVVNSGNGFKVYNGYSVSTLQTAFYGWAIDGYNDANNFGSLERGEIQRDITAGITAGQSLNDSQKESVRRYLFLFEEYYKSAAAILNKITQILEKMAQAIAR